MAHVAREGDEVAGTHLDRPAVRTDPHPPGEDHQDVLARGWQRCYAGTYDLDDAEREGLDTILEDCEGAQLMLACRPVGADNFTLAAEGRFDEVTRDVGNGQDARHNHNGVDWYYSTGRSWGFAPEGIGVSRNSCDTTAEGQAQRMCWHTSGNHLDGGWSCGNDRGLNNNDGWERLVFTRTIPPGRNILMRCGDSNRDPATFVDEGDGLVNEDGCVPNDNVQALLVPRSGAGQVAANAAAWREYLRGGGNIITEYNVSDEVYNAIFQADVAQGDREGNCQDGINPPVRDNLNDPFWRANGDLPVEGGPIGCGHDMSDWGEPIVRLGGWNAETTSLAYRRLGAGVLWLVESDWQDPNDGFNAASRTLMRYMILRNPGGAVRLGEGRGFGHHGSCQTFNGCEDAGTCANAACAVLGHGPALSWEEGRCQDLAAANGGEFDCDLFRALPDNLDDGWGGGCNIPLAYDVVCEGRGITFEGIRQNIPEQELLDGGFEECWSAGYNQVTAIDDILADCDGAVLLLGCRPNGRRNLTLGAMGERDEVTFVQDAAGESHEHNGAQWYFSRARSWGFAPLRGHAPAKEERLDRLRAVFQDVERADEAMRGIDPPQW